MTTLTEIKALWKADAVINELDLSKESLRSPMLHSKYLDLLVDAKRKLSSKRRDLIRMQQFKIKYWNGHCTKDELVALDLPQYQFTKPLKGELDDKLSADDDCIQILEHIEELEVIVFTLESIMKAINSRGWDIKNSIEWNKFQAGG